MHSSVGWRGMELDRDAKGQSWESWHAGDYRKVIAAGSTGLDVRGDSG